LCLQVSLPTDAGDVRIVIAFDAGALVEVYPYRKAGSPPLQGYPLLASPGQSCPLRFPEIRSCDRSDAGELVQVYP